jgi:hypothetical protein
VTGVDVGAVGTLAAIDWRTGDSVTLGERVAVAPTIDFSADAKVLSRQPGSRPETASLQVGFLSGAPPVVVAVDVSAPAYGAAPGGFSPDGASVLYRGASGGLFAVGAGGGSAVTVTTGYSTGAWSADGRSHAIAQPYTYASWTTSLEVFSAADWSVTASAAVPESSCSAAAFSPGAARAFFTCGSRLYAIDATGGAQAAALLSSSLTWSAMASAAAGAPLAFTPDGARVLFLSGDLGGPVLHAAPVAGGAPVALAPAASRAFWPAPDSERVLVRDGDRLLSAPVAGGGFATLGTGVTTVTMSPDGQIVAFVAGGALAAVPIGGTAPVALASGVDAFEFAPDGAHLVVEGTDGSLSIASVTGGAALVASNVAGFEYSPDGSHVLARTTGGALWLAALAGGAPQLLGAVVGTRQYTPDGTRLLFVEAGGTLRVVSAAGGEVTTLAERVVPWSVSVSPSGSRVAFEADGLVATVPIGGGAITRYMRGAWPEWIDGAHLLLSYAEVAPPYRFQAGLYLATVP